MEASIFLDKLYERMPQFDYTLVSGRPSDETDDLIVISRRASNGMVVAFNFDGRTAYNFSLGTVYMDELVTLSNTIYELMGVKR